MNIIKKNEGFTLIELIATISLIFLFISFFNFEIKGWISKIKLQAEMRSIYSQLLKARQLAIINQNNYGIKFKPEDRTYILIKEEKYLDINKLRKGIKYKKLSFGKNNLVTFTPLGTARAGHIKIENFYADSIRIIVAPHTGRIRYEKTN